MKRINPVGVKSSIDKGELSVKVNNGYVLLGSNVSGEFVRIADLKSSCPICDGLRTKDGKAFL